MSVPETLTAEDRERITANLDKITDLASCPACQRERTFRIQGRYMLAGFRTEGDLVDPLRGLAVVALHCSNCQYVSLFAEQELMKP